MGWLFKGGKLKAAPAEQAVDKPYVPVPRALPHASHVEIAARRSTVGKELRARLYLYDDSQLLISSVSGIAETGLVTVLTSDVDDEVLGLAVCDHLLAFQRRSPENLRDDRLADWAVYRASGAKSGKRFEEKAWMVMIDTINSAIQFQVRPRITLHSEIFAGGQSGSDHANCGATLKRTLLAAKALRAAGLV